MGRTHEPIATVYGVQIMHAEDEADAQISNYYGVWPTIIGLLFGALLIWFMFAFADGFA